MSDTPTPRPASTQTTQTVYLIPTVPEWDGEANRVRWIEHATRPDWMHEEATWTPDEDEPWEGMARHDAIHEATRHSNLHRCSSCSTLGRGLWHDEASVVRTGQDDPRHHCHSCGITIESDILDTDAIVATLPEGVEYAIDSMTPCEAHPHGDRACARCDDGPMVERGYILGGYDGGGYPIMGHDGVEVGYAHYQSPDGRLRVERVQEAQAS